jgi:hypothetical protein
LGKAAGADQPIESFAGGSRVRSGRGPPDEACGVLELLDGSLIALPTV